MIRDGRLDFQLTYGDCDAVGISFFAIYYRWMERTYSSWMFAHGLRSGELADQLGVLTVGLSSSATYLRAAKVFDELTCQLVLDRIGTTSYTVGYEFTRDDELVTRGRIAYACRNTDWSGARVPGQLRDLLKTLPEPRFPVPAEA